MIKKSIKNYWPNSIYPIFSKVFERLGFNSLFNYFIQYNLFPLCKSEFIPGDSCISQLISITDEIYKSFDWHLPCDSEWYFHWYFESLWVWHESLIFNLKWYSVDGNLLKLLENYLIGRQQIVVSQGSVLGSLLFLIYIDDLPDGIDQCVKSLELIHLYFLK